MTAAEVIHDRAGGSPATHHVLTTSRELNLDVVNLKKITN